MARILIATRGTHGDHFPFFMIAGALKRRGHRVTLAVNRAMKPHACRFGLPVIECGFSMGREVARRGAASWNYWHPELPGPGDSKRRDPWENVDPLFRACKAADLLVHSSLLHAAPLAEVLTGIPRVTLCFSPVQVCTDPDESTETIPPDPLWEKVIEARKSVFFRGLRRLAAEIPLPAEVFTLDWWEEHLMPDRLALAASPLFARAKGRFAGAPSIGFIFHEDPAPWEPDPELERFLDADPPPLALSFSSLPLEDPARVLGLHARAARELGLRLLVQSGWAGFKSAHLPRDVDKTRILIRDFIPHDWLLPRICALMHHGGTGTTGRALKHACPMLVEPYGNDQFFNAERVIRLGTGAAVHPFDITPDGMARVLEGKVLTRFFRIKAEALAKDMSRENGLETACDFIEKFLD